MLKIKDMNVLSKLIVNIISTFRLGHVTITRVEDTDYVVMNNLTLINFVIYVFGPMHEKRVVQVLMVIQV